MADLLSGGSGIAMEAHAALFLAMATMAATSPLISPPSLKPSPSQLKSLTPPPSLSSPPPAKSSRLCSGRYSPYRPATPHHVVRHGTGRHSRTGRCLPLDGATNLPPFFRSSRKILNPAIDSADQQLANQKGTSGSRNSSSTAGSGVGRI